MLFRAVKLLAALKSDRRGYASVQYILLSVMVSVSIAGVFSPIGEVITSSFNYISASLQAVN